MGLEIQQNACQAEPLSETPKVLIFDEDVEHLDWHAEPFETLRFEVYKCMSIETAMRCAEREELDFALVDQVSAAFEGRRVLRHLVRYNLRTPCIVMAKCKDALCHQQALALGALDYLEKPVPRLEINRFIKRYLGSSLPEPICLL
jgi:DNA-binding NtrC family response regulator